MTQTIRDLEGKSNLLLLFPMERRNFWRRAASQQSRLQEIRIRCNKPVILLLDGREVYLDENGNFTENQSEAYPAGLQEIEALVNHICHYSLYAFADEMRQGFITVPGGHRVGIAGQVVMENDSRVRTIKNISCVNIRIAHEIRGAADGILPRLYQKDSLGEGNLKNVLIISPPGCGKTTLLRDMIRQISDGNAFGRGMSVGLVDERSEIAGSYGGVPQNDVGMRTDVLDACPKAQGMMLLLRSMSPRVIAIDELGGDTDIQALYMAAYCGSKIVATVHGTDVGDVLRRFGNSGRELIHFFDCFLILAKEQGKPVIREILERKDAYAAICRRDYDCGRLSGTWPVVSESVHTETGCFAKAYGDIGDAHERNPVWESNFAGMLQESGGTAERALSRQPS